MGNSFSVSCDKLVTPFLRHLCFNNLEDSLDDLLADMQRLRARRDDLLIRARRAEGSGLGILSEVDSWISRVWEIESEANRLLDESISVIPTLFMYGYCSRNAKSTYEYSKKVDMTSKEVKDLIRKGAFEVVSTPLPPTRMQERLLVPIVSREKLLESIWIRLMDVSILGIYGMEGVGKSTLLKQLNSKFSEVGGYDLVMFIVVALKDIESLQEEIGKRLHLRFENRKHRAATIIYRVLARKRYILLLDDVIMLNISHLQEIGVPFPSRENGCKIVFTTYSVEVSRRFGPDSVNVECLPPDEAWDLFQKKVGRGTLTSHPEIPALARIVAEKCRGFPLALVVLGETMSCKRTIQEWRHAIHVLISSSYDFSIIEGSILPILKYSYDALPGENIRICFLYCALFPQCADIRRQDLANYWVGEGLVSDDIKGYEVIDHLVGASLLVEDESGYDVKMHDLFREMALWITSGDWLQMERFVVNGPDGRRHMPEINDWRNVRRVSVTYTRIESISDSPNCSELTTLFLQHNKNLKQISSDFFRRMVSLAVLDLSHNINLSKLPEEVSCLVSLKLLNLSGTSIKDLPNGLRFLIQLIHLDLESTPNLRSINLISGLLKLQVLRFYGSGAALGISLLKNLERLEDLKLLTISVREVDVLKTFLRSRLSGCTQGLYLEGLGVSGVSGQSLAATMGALSSLRNVKMVNCDILESDMEWEDGRRHQYSPSTSFNEITPRSPSTSSIQITPTNPWFMNLSTVVLIGCQHVKDLTWLIYAAKLESLSVESSPKMEEVISEEKAAGVSVEPEPFLNLQVLRLENMPSLKSICWSSLSLPRLRKVDIKKCPNLHKLPFNSTSVEKIHDLDIEMDDGWIDRIEWEDGAEDRFRHVIRTASVSQLHPVIHICTLFFMCCNRESMVFKILFHSSLFTLLFILLSSSFRCCRHASLQSKNNQVRQADVFDAIQSSYFCFLYCSKPDSKSFIFSLMGVV